MKRYAAALAAILTLPFAGCAGGGGSAAIPARPATSHATNPVQFAVNIPLGSSTQSNARRPQYISVNTQSISLDVADSTATPGVYSPIAGYPIVIATSSGSPNCTTSGGYRTCTATLTNIPTDGSNVGIRMIAYSGPNATGSVLGDSNIDGQSWIPQQPVYKGGTYSLSATLGGVVARFVLSQPQMLVEGTAASLPWSIKSYDASGAVIVPPGGWTDSNGYALEVQNMTGLPVTYGPAGSPSCVGAGTFGPDCANATIAYAGGALTLPDADYTNAIDGSSLFQYEIANTASSRWWIRADQLPIASFASLSQGAISFASPSSPAQTITLALPSGALLATATASNSDVNLSASANSYTISPNSSFCAGSCSTVLTFARAIRWNKSADEIEVPVLIGPGPYPAYTAFQAGNLTIPSTAAGSTPFVVADLSQPQTSGLTWSMATQFCITDSHTITWPPASSGSDTGNIVPSGSNPVFSTPATATMSGGSASFAITPLARGTCQVKVSESTTGFSSYYYITVGP